MTLTTMGVLRQAVLAAAVLVATAGCALWGIEGGPGGAGISAPSATPAAATVATVGPDGVQRVAITVDDDLRFTPSVVRARPGNIEFTFTNAGATPHDIELSQPASGPALATGNLNGGQASTIRVTIEQPGDYPYPCRYHVSSGMTGTLRVSN